MAKEQSILGDRGIVYGSGNNVLAWHEGLPGPVLLASRFNGKGVEKHVTTIAYRDGNLFDAGHEGMVRNTLTGESVGIPGNGPIFALDFLGGELIAARHVEGAWPVEGFPKPSPGASIEYVQTGKRIVLLGKPEPPTSERKNWWSNDLKYRGHSLDLAVTRDGTIYVASENVIALHLGAEQEPHVERKTTYLSDFVHLAADGAEVLDVSTHNSRTHPEGTRVRRTTTDRRLTFWRPSGEYEGTDTPIGYGQMVALDGDTLVVGASNFDAKENNLYVVSISDAMYAADGGLPAKPQLLLRHAFDTVRIYGTGNPIAVVPRRDLDMILGAATRRSGQ